MLGTETLSNLRASVTKSQNATDPRFQQYQAERRAHWDAVAEIYGQIIPSGSRVLEIGCGRDCGRGRVGAGECCSGDNGAVCRQLHLRRTVLNRVE